MFLQIVKVEEIKNEKLKLLLENYEQYEQKIKDVIYNLSFGLRYCHLRNNFKGEYVENTERSLLAMIEPICSKQSSLITNSYTAGNPDLAIAHTNVGKQRQNPEGKEKILKGIPCSL